jgi:hypothetical protein
VEYEKMERVNLDCFLTCLVKEREKEIEAQRLQRLAEVADS